VIHIMEALYYCRPCSRGQSTSERLRLAATGRQRTADGALNGEAHTLPRSSRLAKNFKIQPVASCARNGNSIENGILPQCENGLARITASGFVLPRRSTGPNNCRDSGMAARPDRPASCPAVRRLGLWVGSGDSGESKPILCSVSVISCSGPPPFGQASDWASFL
jgi:hypothetical protein